MKEQLDKIISTNEEAPSLEKLESQELIIDLEEREKLIVEGERQVSILDHERDRKYVLYEFISLPFCIPSLGERTEREDNIG